jgi:hypothetical protein
VQAHGGASAGANATSAAATVGFAARFDEFRHNHQLLVNVAPDDFANGIHVFYSQAVGKWLSVLVQDEWLKTSGSS